MKESSTKFQDLASTLSGHIDTLRAKVPESMQGFSSLAASSMKKGSLSLKTKELITLGIAVSQRCNGCIAFHVRKLIALKVSEEELMETLAVAVYMGGGPALMYAAEAVQAFEEFQNASSL